MAHACVCHQVKGMEVHPDEGGVTKTVGGLQWIILPAVRRLLQSPASLYQI